LNNFLCMAASLRLNDGRNVFCPAHPVRDPTLLVISALAFVLMHLAPGGPFNTERKPPVAR
jgi:hypothetical protein